MLTDASRHMLATAIRDAKFRSIFLSEAARLTGLAVHALRTELADDPLLEGYDQKTLKGFSPSVRLKLNEANVLTLLPVNRGLLDRVYTRDALLAVLLPLHASGQIHEAKGEVRLGAGAAPSTAAPGVRQVQALGEEVPATGASGKGLTADEVRVLNALENIEERRINFGLYETYTTAQEVAQSEEVRAQLGDSAIPGLLASLVAKRYVVEPRSGLYRSRISEMVRLLKNVKQRFRDGDEAQAPYLVQSLRVRFKDRERLRRETRFREVLDGVQGTHRGRKVRAATRLLGEGFSSALGRPLDQVDVTNVQARSFTELTDAYFTQTGGAFVITGNTGSGKTEAALLPLLTGLLEEIIRDDRRGVKVMLVYPRQNLAKNQLERLCEYVAHVNRAMRGPAGQGLGLRPLSVGMVFGNTPGTLGDLQGSGPNNERKWHWDRSEDGQRHVVPYFTGSGGSPVLAQVQADGRATLTSDGGFDAGGWQLDTFQATRESVLQAPPDLLIITTEMLHRWMMDPKALGVFGLPRQWSERPAFHPPRAVVMDEIHLYSGIHGSQIAALLRRLKYRIDNAMYGYARGTADEATTWRTPLLIGMSATIGRPGQFWSKLTGVPEYRVSAIEPQPEDYDPAQGRDYFLFIRPESFSRGKVIGDASAAIQTIMTIAHNMVRRPAEGQTPAKHRTLIFQDSISKLKKLTVEFRDAESRLNLAALRLRTPAGDVQASAAFRDGEYWYFEAQDPHQFNEGRTRVGAAPTALTSADHPVFSGGGQDGRVLNRDIIFATTSLEVGYDDPSIQFVMQHHAPSNIASFVQKKGRAGRDLSDRPITAVTLSRSSYRDAFYFQNPEALTDPADYEPALNPENDFIQRFHAVALLFDELTQRTGRLWYALPVGTPLQNHLDAIFGELTRLDARYPFITNGYERVIAATLRQQEGYRTWQALWEWFQATLLDPEVRHRADRPTRTRPVSLLQLCPDIPENLFSSVNLPVVQVMVPPPRADMDWNFVKEDVALTFSEFGAGRVTRRYGTSHLLHWRSPTVRVNGVIVQNAMAMERYKKREGGGYGPFKPALIKDLPTASGLGDAFEQYMPLGVRRLYGEMPKRFYRLRYLELWSFGRLDPNNPKSPVQGAQAYGRKRPDGSVELRQLREEATAQAQQALLEDGWRVVSPDSNSYPLSFSAVHPLGEARLRVPVPPLFGSLVQPLEYYYGEQDGQRSRLAAWEVQYGAEATIVLHKRHPQGEDPQAGRGHNLVRYVSEHDGEPLLYGYDLCTEGLRVPYDPQVLSQAVQAIAQQQWADVRTQVHLQDQFLRYLLKSEPWAEGVEDGLNTFTQRRMADVLCTMRAEARAQGQSGPEFLAALRDPDGWQALVRGAQRYWADHRTLHPDFLEQARVTWQDDRAYEKLRRLFARIQNKAQVSAYVRDTLVHSLKHAVRNMFMMQGSADHHQIGSGTQLHITHGHDPQDHAFYVYERNQDGAGSTRAAARVMGEHPAGERTGHHVTAWWRYTLECPVAEEQQFVKAVLAPNRRTPIAHEVQVLLALPAHERKDDGLRRALVQATDGLLRDDSPELMHLATVLTSEVHVNGERFAHLDVLLELLDLESELSARFHRTPLPQELAGYALTLLKEDRNLPHLKRLLQVYRTHFQQVLVEEQGEEEMTADDRFLAQVESWSLSTCVDACPACLAGSCDQGHIDVTRHNVSRTLLKRAHEVLTAPITVRGEDLDVAEVVRLADTHGGFVLHEHQGHLSDQLVRAFARAGLQQQGRVFDPEHLTLRTVLYRQEAL